MNDINTLVSPPSAPIQPGGARTVPITVAYGDGIGPEIMEASLRVLLAGGADIAPETITIGEQLQSLIHNSRRRRIERCSVLVSPYPYTKTRKHASRCIMPMSGFVSYKH